MVSETDSNTPKLSGNPSIPVSREKLLHRHPVKEGEFTLPTPMMAHTYSLVREVVWTRRTGTVFYASPRRGKTRCARAIKELLEEEFPNIYVTLLSARESGRPSHSHMFRLILEAEHHVLSARANADVLFGNAVADIRVKAAQVCAKQFVLMIDEMQLLTQTDLQQLVCFHNQLELQDLRMTTVSFAQPEILHRRTSLIASNARQIIARFMSSTLPFNGPTSESDFKTLLRCYDLASEFPEKTGITYTQFFLPEAFQAGFRLEGHCSSIWEALQHAAGARTAHGLPMEHTCLTIQHLLLMQRHHDSSNFVLDQADIEAAVAASQLRSFMESMG